LSSKDGSINPLKKPEGEEPNQGETLKKSAEKKQVKGRSGEVQN